MWEVTRGEMGDGFCNKTTEEKVSEWKAVAQFFPPANNGMATLDSLYTISSQTDCQEGLALPLINNDRGRPAFGSTIG